MPIQDKLNNVTDWAKSKFSKPEPKPITGVISYPNGNTSDSGGSSYAQQVTNYMRSLPPEEQSSLGMGSIPVAPKTKQYTPNINPEYSTDDPTYKAFQEVGLDLNRPEIRNLLNEKMPIEVDNGPLGFLLGSRWTPVDRTVHYTNYNHPANSEDRLALFAHEAMHNKARGYVPEIPPEPVTSAYPEEGVTRYRYYGHNGTDMGYKSDHASRILTEEDIFKDYGKEDGAFLNEFPAIVQEWTYNQPEGMIRPVQKQYLHTGKAGIDSYTRKPSRGFTSKDSTTDVYLRNLFPLVNPEDLQSSPGQEYTYWNSGKEGDTLEGPKRLIPDTPSGWWVAPSGKYERTGGDLISPEYYFKEDTPISQLPPNLRRHIQNMTVLHADEPYSEEREIDRRKKREEAMAMLAPLGLRRKFPMSGDKTLGELIDRVNADRQDANYRNGFPVDYYEGGHYDPYFGKADPPVAFPPYSTKLDKPPMYYQDTAIWDPNRVLEPLPIGLADLQKKYSITPTLTEDSDTRSPEQYQQIIDDAQHSYDLQDYLNRYWDQGGGNVGS